MRRKTEERRLNVRAGRGGEVYLHEGLGGVRKIRLLFESAAREGCWVRIEAPGSVERAIRLARAIEAGFVNAGFGS